MSAPVPADAEALPPPADARPWLVLDAAGDRVRTGLLGARGVLAWREDPGDALVALFAGTRAVLAEAGLRLADIGVVVRALGPGSVLGLRLAAVAAGTWCDACGPLGAAAPRPAGFPVLVAAARLAALALGTGGAPAVSCEFKEGRRLLLRPGAAEAEAIPADAPHDPADGPLFWVPMRRRRIPPPAGARVLDPSPADWDRVLRGPGLVRPCPTTHLELGPPPSYRRWEGGRHRAPASPAPERHA